MASQHRCGLRLVLSVCGAVLVAGIVSSGWVAAQISSKAPDQEQPAEKEDSARLYERAVGYEKGSGGAQKDEREAARLYRLAADRGSAKAQSSLGFLLR